MNNSKVDRRRQQRVQGSWNKPPAWTNKNVDQARRRPRDDQHNGEQHKEFTYDSSVAAAAQKEVEEDRGPTIIPITETGVYELSVDRHGIPAIVRFFPDFLTKDEADSMFNYLCTNLPWQQRTGMNREGREYKEPRLTCWFGEPYVYSHVAWDSNHEWPVELMKLRTKVSENTGVEYNSVMCNLYRHDKDSIGWHADDEPSLGKHPNIASISLGCVRNFELKLKEDHYANLHSHSEVKNGRHYSVPLPNGSLLIMEGSIQDDWLHRVPKEYHDKSTRINLTFRVIVNSPDETLNISQSTRKVISRGQQDNSPAVINYQQRHINKHSLQECSNYFTEGSWVRPNNRDGGHALFQMCSFTSYDPWPNWLTAAGRDVIHICSARSDRRIEWSSAQCIFLQRGTEYLPGRYEQGQNPVALVCLWGSRPIKMRRSNSAVVIGDLKTVSVQRCNPGDVFVMEGNVQRHWTFSIPRDPRANYSSCFLLLRAEEPYPAGTLFQVFDESSNSAVYGSGTEVPHIHLETAAEACGHVDLCDRCSQALSLGQTPDCPVCQAELKRSKDFMHP